MRRSLLFAAALLACFAARAEGIDWSVKPKAIASEAAARSQAPFSAAREGWPASIAPGAAEPRRLRSDCASSGHAVCYDAADGRIVYRPARSLMPRIGDLAPEGISLRRDRILLRYSF